MVHAPKTTGRLLSPGHPDNAYARASFWAAKPGISSAQGGARQPSLIGQRGDRPPGLSGRPTPTYRILFSYYHGVNPTSLIDHILLAASCQGQIAYAGAGCGALFGSISIVNSAFTNSCGNSCSDKPGSVT